MADQDSKLHVVTLGDRDQLDSHPTEVARLVSMETLNTFASFPSARDDFPIFFCSTEQGRVVSYARTIPDMLSIDGSSYRWAWTGDSYTPPEFRGHGYATRLHTEATEYLDRHNIARGTVYSNDTMLHLYQKMGFPVAHTGRLVAFRTLRPMVDAHVKRRLPALVTRAALAPCSFLWVLGLVSCTRMSRTKTVRVAVSTENSDEWADALNLLTQQRRIHFDMHRECLEKKVEIARRRGRVNCWIICSQMGMPIAYLITRERLQEKPLARRYKGFRLMSVMDFAFADADGAAATAVVDHTLRMFFEGDSEVLEIITSNPLIHRAARRRGMLPLGRGMSFAYHVPASWQLPTLLKTQAGWPLTNFCGDAFSF